MELEYRVTVSGLGEAAASARSAGASAAQASAAMSAAQGQGSRALPVLTMSVRSFNAARLAVEQTSRAITDLDPRAAMYGFLNMVQVVRNLNSLMAALRESTGAASAAQAILATLTGRWWLIPLALAAGAVIYSRIRSMQEGGLVPETGPYLLHRGEAVLPVRGVHVSRELLSQRTVQSFGPIFITFERGPGEGLEMERWMRGLGPRLVEEARRG